MNVNAYENELEVGRQLEIHEMDLLSVMNHTYNDAANNIIHIISDDEDGDDDNYRETAASADDDEDGDDDANMEDQSAEANNLLNRLIGIADGMCDPMILKDYSRGRIRLRIYNLPDNVVDNLLSVCANQDLFTYYGSLPYDNGLFDFTVIV